MDSADEAADELRRAAKAVLAENSYIGGPFIEPVLCTLGSNGAARGAALGFVAKESRWSAPWGCLMRAGRREEGALGRGSCSVGMTSLSACP